MRGPLSPKSRYGPTVLPDFVRRDRTERSPSGLGRYVHLSLGVALLLGGGIALGSSSTALAASGCPPHVVADGASPATLRACGVVSYPIKSLVRLWDGGTKTTYATPGGSTGVLVPPKGFDAATASAAELALYGIPPEPPSSSPAYAMWFRMVNNLHWTPAPKYLQAIPGLTMGGGIDSPAAHSKVR